MAKKKQAKKLDKKKGKNQKLKKAKVKKKKCIKLIGDPDFSTGGELRQKSPDEVLQKQIRSPQLRVQLNRIMDSYYAPMVTGSDNKTCFSVSSLSTEEIVKKIHEKTNLICRVEHRDSLNDNLYVFEPMVPTTGPKTELAMGSIKGRVGSPAAAEVNVATMQTGVLSMGDRWHVIIPGTNIEVKGKVDDQGKFTTGDVREEIVKELKGNGYKQNADGTFTNPKTKDEIIRVDIDFQTKKLTVFRSEKE
jgi:hypothetical protein